MYFYDESFKKAQEFFFLLTIKKKSTDFTRFYKYPVGKGFLSHPFPAARPHSVTDNFPKD